MALGATIYKATVDISDIDRGYYGTHLCTLARHPSETEERLAIRLLTRTITIQLLKMIFILRELASR